MDKQFIKIKDKVDNLDEISSWSDKFQEIQNIKNLIKERKQNLNKLLESINENIEENEFDDFDLDKVLEQIKKSNSIDKQVRSLKSLKEWVQFEKNKVFKQ
jgi:DNA repair ATPase RecN